MYNLCILTSHFYPIKSSCSSLFKDLIKSLLKNDNIKITVITISGTKKKIKTINTRKITYVGIKNLHLQSSKKYSRAIGDILAILKLRNFYKKNNFPKFDQVLVYSPSIFWGIILFALKKKFVSIKLGDLYPKWLIDHKIINKFSINFLVLKFFEIFLYLQANKIYVQTEKDVSYISKYEKLLNFKTSVLYNWIRTENIVSNKYIKKNPKIIRFIIVGVIGVAQDYKLLYKMIKFCNDKNYKSVFYFIGSGTKKKKLIELTSNFKNVFFYPEMHISKLDETIKKVDVCISTLIKDFKSDNFPGKILRYMVNNKPIISHSPNNNFLEKLIKNNSLGVFSSNEKELFSNIEYIFSDFDSFKKKGSDGLNIAKKFFSTEYAKEIILKK